MTESHLTRVEKACLLELARRSITLALSGRDQAPAFDPETLPARLREPGVSFVTLTIDGELRGCIGALEPYQSLAEDVWEHSQAAAFEDYRFPPLQQDELESVRIEISYLTQPVPLEYTSPADLVARLRPGVDGVILRDGIHRATFLPQVWEKLPNPQAFLDHLCQKMGAPVTLWRTRRLQVSIYEVESFEEPGE